MSTSPVQATCIRKGSLPSSFSALSLSSSPSAGSKFSSEHKAQSRNCTEIQTTDGKEHFKKADKLPDSKDQYKIADNTLDDDGCYEKADNIFVTDLAKSCERDVVAVPQETEQILILGKPQTTVTRSVPNQNRCSTDSNPYLMEDVEVSGDFSNTNRQ